MPQSKWILEKAVFGGTINLNEGLTTIGRNHHSTIVASSDYVSRNHAQIHISPDSVQIWITDLGSKNGIYVNEFQYCNAECELNVGDRIGIGVEVEDDVVLNFPEGKYPIYILRRQPDEETPPAPISQIQEERILSPPPSRSDPPDKPNDKDDEIGNKSDDEFAQLALELEVNEPVKIKTEADFQAVSTSRKICENIKNIFGDLNSEILNALPEETRKIAESSNKFQQPVVCEDIICISSSEDEDCDSNDKRQSKVTSPQLFNDSFNSGTDKGAPQSVEQHQTDKQQNNIKIPQEKEIIKSLVVEARAVDAVTEENNQEQVTVEGVDLKPLKDEFQNDEDDMWFTQQIFEDMKECIEEMNEEAIKPDNIKIEPEDPIKQEIYPQTNLDGTIINLDDDDEYDEDLETTTQKWTTRLSKHIFSNSFNASQVYEDPYSDDEEEEADEIAPASKTIFIVDDDDDELDFVDEVARKEIKIEPGIETSSESEIIKPSKRNVNQLHKELFSSSDDEKDDEEDQNEKPSTSVASLDKFHKKVIRRMSTSDEIPRKKPRLSKRSEDDDQIGDKLHVRRPSSSHKTYSRRGSGSKSAKEDDTNDVFEKLKQDDKSKESTKKKRKTSTTSSTSSTHKHSHERKKSTDKRSYSRSDSTHSTHSDQNGSSIYKSAKIARMKSVDRHLSTDHNHNDDDCFVDVKKPSVELSSTKAPEECGKVPTTPKTIRGPPVLIEPPKLPVNKGKLRGISAVQIRIADALKATAEKSDLKRKWLEKPSKKKDREIARAIQETRRQKLKELNSKKQAENTAPKEAPTKETAAEKEASRKKLKVKITQNNRGAFLTEQPPPAKVPYKIPKKTTEDTESTAKSSLTPKTVVPPPKKPPEQRKPSTEAVVANSFSQELAEVDKVLQKQIGRTRLKSTETTTREQKQCAPPRPNKKSVNFASMNQHFEETKRAMKKMKKVTFKLPPEIRYIESTLSSKPKRFQRESSTYMERKTNIRQQYPILDKTETLLDDVLSWSQIWLEHKHNMVNMMTFPMHNSFKTFNEYKNNVLPLLKMEYLGFLEQSMEQNASKFSVHAEIDYSAPHKHRDYIFAKCNSPIRPSELSFNDLALIDIPLGSTTRQLFGYISNIRQGGAGSCITIEISTNTISKEILKTKPKIKIRRIIDGIRMHLGTFNAVHQLEQTPLLDKVLNPIELLKTENNIRLQHIEYKGFTDLNREQREILLKTYERAIDQLNPSISLINGPPGTGKSVLISNLAVQLLYGNEVNELDKKILICAQSNMAVDVIAEKLIKLKEKLSPDTSPFNVVRYGVEEKVHPNVRGITLKAVLQRHRTSILRKQGNQIDEHVGWEDSLAKEIVQLEARIMDLEKQTFQDVRQEELVQMRKNLQLKKNIVNQIFRPEDEKRLSRWFLENANIVCCTLSGCIKLATFVNYFDICIIDEATQCTEPWTLMPLKFGVRNLIMVGDTQQLPATVISQSAKELGLEISLFTRIKTCLENKYADTTEPIDTKNPPIYTLKEQYRMHSEISKWPNMYFYKNQLRNNPKTDEFKSSIKPFSILNLEYRQNDTFFGQVSGQISNNLEAEFVAKLVTTLDNYIPNKFYSYGVITPYAHHREKLENMIRNSGLKNIMVNTIDSYQGIEKDVIIISNARTHGVGFLGNYQRLNVALTRPRKCLILCGNFKNLESVPSWASLLANAKERGLYHNISANDALDITKNVIEKIKIKR